MRRQFLVFLLLLQLGGNITSKDRETVFERCCRAGAIFAEHNRLLNCSRERGFPVTASNAPSDTISQQQILCASTQYLCCLEKHRQLQCSEGISAALEGNDCNGNTTTSRHEGFKDCCDGCKLGLTAATLQAACSSEQYSLLRSWKESFTECCRTKKHQHQSQSSPGNVNRIGSNQSSSSASINHQDPPYRISSTASFIAQQKQEHSPSTKSDVERKISLGNVKEERLNSEVSSTNSEAIQQYDPSRLSLHSSKSIQPAVQNGRPGNEIQAPGRSHLFLGTKGATASTPRSILNRASLPDVDACQLFSTDLCQHLCISMVGGSYRCDCRAGYLLNPDGSTCSEIDKNRERPLCEEENPCAQVCGQTDGGIECSCHEGFQLANDGVNCIDVDECSSGVHECLGGHMCFNEPAGYGCLDRQSRQVYRPLLNKQNRELQEHRGQQNQEHRDYQQNQEQQNNQENQEQQQPPENREHISAECPGGFRFNAESSVCDDVDECEDSRACPEHQLCRNTVGGYSCDDQFSSCPAGFEFDLAFQTCIDIDECGAGHICDAPDHVCVNTPGSYTCVPGSGDQCPAGFKPSSRPDTPCQDVDECRERLDGCDATNEICRNTIGGYECDVRCLPGFEYDFLSDSCEDIDECLQSQHNCSEGDLCVNTEGSFTCVNNCSTRCSEGQKCLHTDSGYECVDDDGVASESGISCPVGFIFSNRTQHCEDVDECVVNTSVCSEAAGKLCVNTVGSYICAQSDIRCPIGFVFNSQLQICIDVDECETGTHNCTSVSEYCSNLVGGFICRRRFDAPRCATGFAFDASSSECQDIDECFIGNHNCEQPLTCINLPGSFTCSATGVSSNIDSPSGSRRAENNDNTRNGARTDQISGLSTKQLRQILAESQIGTETGADVSSKDTVIGSESSRCNAGFKKVDSLCLDVDECKEDTHLCSRTLEKCVNIRGGYRCILQATPPSFTTEPPTLSTAADYSSSVYKSPVTPFPHSSTSSSIHLAGTKDESVQPRTTGQSTDQELSYPEKKDQDKVATSTECQSGSTFSQTTNRCEDIDQCTINPEVCGENSVCVNNENSYICQCRAGFRHDRTQNKCVDVNECQLGLDNCLDTQRCDNTIGSFSCFRTLGCGTGYTLNADLGICEDDDECTLNWHDCGRRGPRWQCLNTRGSYRCILNSCPPDRTLSADRRRCLPARCRPGYAPDRRGRCRDIDECERSPCESNFQCVNVAGSFRCEPRRRCPPGYQASSDGSVCEDIDECSRDRGPCESDQQCSNTPGGYQCMCPAGYSVSQLGHCQDIDECHDLGSAACGPDSECVNTVGSYSCQCADGFEQKADSSQCTDLDECRSVPGLCHHQCRNTWGSYHCHCDPGYTLSTDRRTCVDIDECGVEGDVCAGQCRNTAGSYECSCPRGYRLSDDGTQCEDINECSEQDVCNADDLCLNINGGYRCNRITCPSGYIRDTAHRNRCTRQSLFCLDSDLACRKRPLSYSFTYLTFTARLPMPPSGRHQLFTMRGPLWPDSRAVFRLRLVDARTGRSAVMAARADDFQLKHSRSNQATVALVHSVAGPQEIELELVMDLYREGQYRGRAVARLFIVVSAYAF